MQKITEKTRDDSALYVSEKTKDRLVLSLPLLWVFMIVFVYMDKGFYGMYLAVLHGCISALLGLVEGEKVNKKLLLAFVIGWGIFMSVSVFGMTYYYNLFGNTVPSFTLWGMHPSGFFLYIFFWLGNLIYLSGIFYYYKDLWLSEEKWNEFVEYAKSIEGGEEDE